MSKKMSQALETIKSKLYDCAMMAFYMEKTGKEARAKHYSAKVHALHYALETLGVENNDILDIIIRAEDNELVSLKERGLV